MISTRSSTIALLCVLGLAAPALAGGQDVAAAGPAGHGISRAEVMSIARLHGVAEIERLIREEQTWHVGGSDRQGRVVDLDIGASDGAVIRIDRDAEFEDRR